MDLYNQNLRMAEEAKAEGAHVAVILSYLAAADATCCEANRTQALTAAGEYATTLKKSLDRQVTGRAIEARNGCSELSTLVQKLIAEQGDEPPVTT